MHRPRPALSLLQRADGLATHTEPVGATHRGVGVGTLPTDACGFFDFTPRDVEASRGTHLALTGTSNCRRPAKVVDVAQTWRLPDIEKI
jgi:hypothetical protein